MREEKVEAVLGLRIQRLKLLLTNIKSKFTPFEAYLRDEQEWVLVARDSDLKIRHRSISLLSTLVVAGGATDAVQIIRRIAVVIVGAFRLENLGAKPKSVVAHLCHVCGNVHTALANAPIRHTFMADPYSFIADTQVPV